MNWDDGFQPLISPLSQTISSGGKTVRIDIISDDAGRWILEIVDEFCNSTVWRDLFDTDIDALIEAKRAILHDGISAYIGKDED